MAVDSLGLRIRRARERKRWTQKQLADAVGVSARAVGDWERNVKTPLNSIGRLEQVLAVDLTSEDQPDPKMEQLLDLIEGLSPGDRDIMLKAWAAIQNGASGKHARNPGRAG